MHIWEFYTYTVWENVIYYSMTSYEFALVYICVLKTDDKKIVLILHYSCGVLLYMTGIY